MGPPRHLCLPSEPGDTTEGRSRIRNAAWVEGGHHGRQEVGGPPPAGPELHAVRVESHRSGRWVPVPPPPPCPRPPHPGLSLPFPSSEMGRCRQIKRLDDPAVLGKGRAGQQPRPHPASTATKSMPERREEKYFLYFYVPKPSAQLISTVTQTSDSQRCVHFYFLNPAI